uniref:Uncharacterized protein n=1 Tax=Lutzomyia longipalpis TaxID=7200 RepID=A0A7G3B4P7_LUTLO
MSRILVSPPVKHPASRPKIALVTTSIVKFAANSFTSSPLTFFLFSFSMYFFIFVHTSSTIGYMVFMRVVVKAGVISALFSFHSFPLSIKGFLPKIGSTSLSIKSENLLSAKDLKFLISMSFAISG